MVAIAVTIQSQPRRALLVRLAAPSLHSCPLADALSHRADRGRVLVRPALLSLASRARSDLFLSPSPARSAGIYTVLAAIIVLFTLNWRATIRAPADGGLGAARGGVGGAAADDATRGNVPTPTFLRSAARGGPATTFEPGMYREGEEGEGAGEGEGPVRELREMEERPTWAADETAGAAGERLYARDAGTAMRRRRSQDQPRGGALDEKDDEEGEVRRRSLSLSSCTARAPRCLLFARCRQGPSPAESGPFLESSARPS